MKATLIEAIKIIKRHQKESEADMLMSSELSEAIDTVVAELEKPTYTAEDMEAFAEWTAIMQWIYDPTDKCWFQKHSTETKTTTKLREQWEDWKAQQRGEATE